ncbi:MAG: DegT/DnrJ/EryC1/StrS family aminotransferase [Desulfatiglans sp.]|jgi:8-amino-3,8-dideoxy-alpha-D-manno-octulosonate transaminase|nr:DegT/DnrJ/EryC1/StrS family aminotransferase [Desulfatiglans sp.]
MPGFEVIGKEEEQEIMEVLNHKILFRYEFDEQRGGMYKVEAFEKAFSEYCGVDCALAVSSGTAALRVALSVLGIGPGDEVITQGFTFVATWEAILDAGAIPVFAEIDDTLCLDPKDMSKKISPRTKAVIPVHMCGSQARVEEIVREAGLHNLPVIEDTAQACGGTLKGKRLGSFGALGTFSFDSVKTLTTGEGGMVITDDRDLFVRASEYHDHGHDHDPSVGRGLEKRSFIGFNYRMMELQGALGLAQLRKLDNVILAKQRENKSRIKEALSRINQVTFRNILDPEGDIASFVMFFLPTREEAVAFNKAMADEGCPAVDWYENTWHYYGKWEHLLERKSLIKSGYPFKDESGKERCRYDPSALPQTVGLLSRCLTIPINIHMEEQIPKIVRAIEKASSAL